MRAVFVETGTSITTSIILRIASDSLDSIPFARNPTSAGFEEDGASRQRIFLGRISANVTIRFYVVSREVQSSAFICT